MKGRALALILTLLLSSSLTSLGVEAQAPEPPNVVTLGPPIICSAGDSATNVKILSPQNHSYGKNPIQLDFSVTAIGMFGQFGNVGYSVDGGIINSVTDFVNKTLEFAGPDWYWMRTIVFASIFLPSLPDGVHNVTVYYGWQYLGTNNPSLERYEVFAYETVFFTVGKPTIIPPKIEVLSPENNTTTEADLILLILNISAPIAVNAMQSQLRYAYYEADWLSEKQYLYFQNLSYSEQFQFLQLNATLSSIPSGRHKLLIVVGGGVTFKQAMFVEEFDSENNSTVVFTVNSSVQPTGDFLISQMETVLIVVLASLAVVGLCLLFYFSKRRKLRLYANQKLTFIGLTQFFLRFLCKLLGRFLRWRHF